MIGVEIYKGGQLYQINLNGWTDLTMAHKYAMNIAAGKEIFSDGDQIVDLGTSNKYEHIRVWREKETTSPAVEPPKEDVKPQSKDYIKSFVDRITWLGQDLHLKGVKAVEDGVPLVLIYEINDEPAQVQLSKENLQELSTYQGQVLGYFHPVALVPHADLHSEEEALEYVEDYVKEIRKNTAAVNDKKTATAFFGFTKDEE